MSPRVGSSDSIDKDWIHLPQQLPKLLSESSKRLAGICPWLLDNDKYEQWKTTPSSTLWLNGSPGTGKTAATTAVIDDLLDSASMTGPNGPHAVAYFFFDPQKSENLCTSDMLLAWVEQLYQGYNLVSKVEDLGADTSWQVLWNELRFLIPQCSSVSLIVDGLEECIDVESAAQRIRNLGELIDSSVHDVRVLVSSRRYPGVADSFFWWLPPESMVTMVTLPPLQSRRDVRKEPCLARTSPQAVNILQYVTSRLEREPLLNKLYKYQKEKETLERAVYFGSSGMFLWAKLALDVSAECADIPSVRHRLCRSIPALDDFYDQILGKVKAEHIHDVRILLQWIVVADTAFPLGLHTLGEILAIDFSGPKPVYDYARRLPDPVKILDFLGDVVTVSPNEMKPDDSVLCRVNPLHSSLGDYLLSNRIQDGPSSRFGFTTGEAHTTIAAMCLAYLEQFEGTDNLQTRETPNTMLLDFIKITWAQHALHPGVDAETLSIALTSWLESGAFQHTKDKISPFRHMVEAGLTEEMEKILHSDKASSARLQTITETLESRNIEWDSAEREIEERLMRRHEISMSEEPIEPEDRSVSEMDLITQRLTWLSVLFGQ
ncbi:MAG: hypothetical protein M1831_001931 [Alyxoria varia]|nr:MAG: hypothetical protein M1831_001931 [Alyxoria varia]